MSDNLSPMRQAAASAAAVAREVDSLSESLDAIAARARAVEAEVARARERARGERAETVELELQPLFTLIEAVMSEWQRLEYGVLGAVYTPTAYEELFRRARETGVTAIVNAVGRVYWEREVGANFDDSHSPQRPLRRSARTSTPPDRYEPSRWR